MSQSNERPLRENPTRLNKALKVISQNTNPNYATDVMFLVSRKSDLIEFLQSKEFDTKKAYFRPPRMPEIGPVMFATITMPSDVTLWRELLELDFVTEIYISQHLPTIKPAV